MCPGLPPRGVSCALLSSAQRLAGKLAKPKLPQAAAFERRHAWCRDSKQNRRRGRSRGPQGMPFPPSRPGQARSARADRQDTPVSTKVCTGGPYPPCCFKTPNSIHSSNPPLNTPLWNSGREAPREHTGPTKPRRWERVCVGAAHPGLACCSVCIAVGALAWAIWPGRARTPLTRSPSCHALRPGCSGPLASGILAGSVGTAWNRASR